MPLEVARHKAKFLAAHIQNQISPVSQALFEESASNIREWLGAYLNSICVTRLDEMCIKVLPYHEKAGLGFEDVQILPAIGRKKRYKKHPSEVDHPTIAFASPRHLNGDQLFLSRIEFAASDQAPRQKVKLLSKMAYPFEIFDKDDCSKDLPWNLLPGRTLEIQEGKKFRTIIATTLGDYKSSEVKAPNIEAYQAVYVHQYLKRVH